MSDKPISYDPIYRVLPLTKYMMDTNSSVRYLSRFVIYSSKYNATTILHYLIENELQRNECIYRFL